MFRWVLVILLLVGLASAQVPPQVGYNVTQLITSNGYTCVEHKVQTDDGYILSVQNIPGNGPPVYLQHGFVDSSATWVMSGTAASLGFILADAGFDVWLGNTRGNTYCMENIHYTNETQEFWNFSWDQIAQYDLPAKINYILKQTGHSTLSYIGHSEGTLIGFTEFSRNLTIASKVNLFVALAPVVYLKDAGELIQIGSKAPPILVKTLFGSQSFAEPWSDIARVRYQVCITDPDLCELTLCALAGCEPGNMNQTLFPVYFSHYPAGSSVQNLLHYMQSVGNQNYQMYDYGSSRQNQNVYGQPTPPLYSLSTFNTTVALFSGSNDQFADPEDVKFLVSQLPTVPNYQEEIQGYGHADFIWGMNAPQILYPKVISLIKTVTGF